MSDCIFNTCFIDSGKVLASILNQLRHPFPGESHDASSGCTTIMHHDNGCIEMPDVGHWNQFGIILILFLHYLSIMLASFWHYVGITLGWILRPGSSKNTIRSSFRWLLGSGLVPQASGLWPGLGGTRVA